MECWWSGGLGDFALRMRLIGIRWARRRRPWSSKSPKKGHASKPPFSETPFHPADTRPLYKAPTHFAHCDSASQLFTTTPTSPTPPPSRSPQPPSRHCRSSACGAGPEAWRLEGAHPAGRRCAIAARKSGWRCDAMRFPAARSCARKNSVDSRLRRGGCGHLRPAPRSDKKLSYASLSLSAYVPPPSHTVPERSASPREAAPLARHVGPRVGAPLARAAAAVAQNSPASTRCRSPRATPPPRRSSRSPCAGRRCSSCARRGPPPPSAPPPSAARAQAMRTSSPSPPSASVALHPLVRGHVDGLPRAARPRGRRAAAA